MLLVLILWLLEYFALNTHSFVHCNLQQEFTVLLLENINACHGTFAIGQFNSTDPLADTEIIAH